MNSMPFKLDDFDNQLIHITNVYQQKNHSLYDPYLDLKWDFAQLDAHVAKEFSFDGSFIKTKFLPHVRDCLEFVIKATNKTLFSKSSTGLQFGLYGADFIIDQNLNPWLTEIQMGPGLGFNDTIKKKVIPPMMKDVVKIMLEVQKRKRLKSSFEDFNDIGNFQWVIGP